MYLIVGANGFLGSYIIKSILKKTEDEIVAVARDITELDNTDRIKWEPADITTEQGLCKLHEITENELDVKVIFLAAYHNPDLVQKNPKVAWDTNVIALSKALNILDNVKCLFYSSTDSVYGESKDLYKFNEDDKLSPVNIYGKQKVVAEAIVCGYGYNVVRFPFLIGKSLLKKKKHFYDAIEEALIGGKNYEMFDNSYRSTLHFRQAADLLIEIIENHFNEVPQILNICGDESLSKYDVGIMIANYLKVDTNLVTPIKFSAVKGVFETPRAVSTVMDNSVLKKILGVEEIKLSFAEA